MLPRAWLLVTIAPVMAVSATFYEVEHFRHLWTWLGLLAALVLVLERPGHAGPEDAGPGGIVPDAVPEDAAR